MVAASHTDLGTGDLRRDEAEIPPFLRGEGEMAARIRAHDWRATPLGAAQDWPQSLKTLVGLMLASDQPMFMAWGPGRTWLYNDAFTPILGRKHPAALGEPALEVWGEARAELEPLFARVFAGQPVQMEDIGLMLDRSGRLEESHFAFSYTPARDESGRVAGLFGACIETTQQVRSIVEMQRAERALRDSENRLRELAGTLERRVAERTAERDRVWRNSRDLLAVVGADGVFRAANPAWEAILGHAPEDMSGRHFRDFVWPDDDDMTQAGFAAATRQNLTAFENRYRHKDGTPRWISWHTSLEGDLVYAYGRDITAEKEQREALRVAEEQLRQAQKMEAVGQLTGGLAHDFNNLLTGITGGLDLMTQRIARGRYGELERYINAAQGAAKRAAVLTHRLLAFSRRQTLDPKPLRVDRLIHGMEELIRRTVGPQIAFQVTSAGALWTIFADPNQLESALLNLCINARDAMPEGGRLTIATANNRLDGAAARERELEPGEYVTLCVTDTGTGMTSETMARAFDPFYTTKPLGMGTGLGLSMIYGFAKQSGGQVRIESELGRGTAVCLYLPRFLGDVAEETSPAAGARAGAARHGDIVLVVEDDQTVRMLVTDLLDEHGYGTLEAADGAAAMRLLQSGARIDLLVTDIGLPGGMNGRQVAEAARQVRPALKVLFITGYDQTAAVGLNFLKTGADVLIKPFEMEELVRRIDQLVAAR
jgi:PAS domain S-box-containing protein